MRNCFLFLAIAPLAATAANAVDMGVMQMRLTNSRAIPTDPAEIKLVQSYGKCIADRTVSRLALVTLPESSNSNRNLFAMAFESRSCSDYGAWYSYSPLNFRGPVAEVLLEADFPSDGPSKVHKGIKVFKYPSQEELARLPLKVRAATSMVRLGECVARADARNVRSLVSSEVGSDEEKQAFTALTPSLSNCIPPAFELRISKFQLRGYIAEGAYRAAVATQEV